MAAGLTELNLTKGYRRGERSTIRGDRTKHLVTINSGLVYGPGKNLLIAIPRLNKDLSIVPGTLNLVYNLNITSAKSYFKNNLSKLLTSKMRITIGGLVVYENNYESIYRVYEDLWMSKIDRTNALEFGIARENLRKLISGEDTGSEDADEAAKEDAIVEKIYKNRQKISLNKILEDNGLYSPGWMETDLAFQFWLPQSSDILVTATGQAAGEYTMTDLELEYETIKSASLASDAAGPYSGAHSWLYEHIVRENSVAVPADSESLTITVDNPRKIGRAIVVLFKRTAGSKDSEEYLYPEIREVSLTYGGETSVIYQPSIGRTYLFEEAKRFFHGGENRPEQNMTIYNFYKDKFALVIDLRTVAQLNLYGNGKKIVGTQTGVSIGLKLSGAFSTATVAHPFLVSDGLVSFKSYKVDAVDQ